MFDKNLLQLPKGQLTLALLLFLSVVDGVLVVAQAASLSLAVVCLWSHSPFFASQLLEGVELGISWVSHAPVSGFFPCALSFLAFFTLRQLLSFGRSSFMDVYSREQAQLLREQLVKALFTLGVPEVQQRGSGATATLTIQGIDDVRSYIGILLPKTADLVAIPLTLTVALFALDWASGLIALVILPCVIGYMSMLGTQAKREAARQHASYQLLSSHFMDTLRGLPTLKSFGRSKPYEKQVYDVSEQARKTSMKTLRTATLSSLVLDLFRTFALAAAAIMLGLRLLDGSIGLFQSLAVLVILPEYFAAVRRYSQDFHASLDGRNSLKAILETLGRARQALNVHSVELETFSKWNKDSVLELNNLRFSYPTAHCNDKPVGDNAAPLTLHDVSLRLKGPMKLALIGPSGSGKSTLARLLAGFASPSSGSIVLDGTPLQSLDNPHWQSQVTFIPQSPHIFSASLRDNVAFYVPNASDEEVQEVLEAVGLDVLARNLPKGIHTLIGEGGMGLSGGQAQRIALARALLDTERRVLVFDEPTAHLDVETELSLKKVMLPLMKDRLVIFATHRLHWIANMDLVAVMEQGSIVQLAAPCDLSKDDGPFSSFVKAMRGGNPR